MSESENGAVSIKIKYDEHNESSFNFQLYNSKDSLIMALDNNQSSGTRLSNIKPGIYKIFISMDDCYSHLDQVIVSKGRITMLHLTFYSRDYFKKNRRKLKKTNWHCQHFQRTDRK